MNSEEIIKLYDALDEKEKEEVRKQIRAIPDPSKKVAGALWIIVVSCFSFALLGGIVLTFFLITGDHPTDVFVPIVTTILGALAGFFAQTKTAEDG